LKPEYIDKLRGITTYNPPEWLLKERAKRKTLEEYPEITAEELAKHNTTENAW